MRKELRQLLRGGSFGVVAADVSLRMSKIKSEDSKPEMIVRRLVHRFGYRYRLHVRSLPGTPDMVFPSRKKIIMIHGCFWHQHDCLGGRRPKSRAKFWHAKLEANRRRDAKALRALRQQGWRVLVVWECEVKTPERLSQRLHQFLGN